ncbi:glucan endo-1,3-beta-glucosidase 9 [Impatiens glandulifera]|uniref:glucan endo-1,3-beta-glucosidase 9 n=1 Tax=Impatiens glandulifera TaxID=253017 RepID=UPI001FB0BBD1|nr:glucan endo-1,3-beta-glucosidase 9 [Impatiens glandulifera]
MEFFQSNVFFFFLHSLLLLFSVLISFSPPAIDAVGVNWGTAASHQLPPAKVVELLKSNKINKVKLFDADPLILSSLSGSNIYVALGIPNSMLRIFNSSKTAAETWVHDNVTRFISSKTGINDVRIEYIVVGDEPFLLSYGEKFYPFVLGAATNIQTALMKANLANKVKVVVPFSSDTFLSDSGLPTKGHFRPDINTTITDLLVFLDKLHSPIFVTIQPFSSYRQNKNISLDFALFKQTANSHKTYQNSLDMSYDTLVAALSAVGFPRMDVVIGQIGWPTDGTVNATSSTAEVFMNGLMDHIRSKSGTPLRPNNPPIETYLYSLLDEDQRSIDTGSFERHWGIFTFDGQAKYPLNLLIGGQGTKSLVNAQNVDYLSNRWCVVNNNINGDLSNASNRALEACSVADCSALSPGGSCFNLSWSSNISYAFNNYYQMRNQSSESCNFGGLGLITTVDPSVGNCRFEVGLKGSSGSRPLLNSVFQYFIFFGYIFFFVLHGVV